MRKSIFTVAALAASVPLLAQHTITCSSSKGKTQFCPANTSNGVMLLQERSNGVCQQGSTWTYSERGISVNSGCSADFQVGGNGGNNGNGAYGSNGNNGNGAYGNNGNNGNGSYGNNGSNGNGSYGQNSPNGRAYPNRSNQNGYPNGNNQNGNDGYGNGNSNDRNNGYGNRQQVGISIPAGTRLDVRLQQAVSAADANQGDLIPGSLANDVSVDGQVVASAGTPVQLKVASAHGAALDIRLDSMSVNGQTYRLVGSSIHSGKESQAGQSGNAGEAIGSMIGALTGGAQLRSGSVYTFRLTSPARPSRRNQ